MEPVMKKHVGYLLPGQSTGIDSQAARPGTKPWKSGKWIKNPGLAAMHHIANRASTGGDFPVFLKRKNVFPWIAWYAYAH